MKTASCILLCALTLLAVDKPRVGFIRDRQGNVRSVDGLAGSFLTGDPVASASVSFASNGTSSVRKADSQIELWDSAGNRIAAFDAGPGAAVIGFDQSTSVVYIKSTGLLWTLTAQGSATSEQTNLPLAKGDDVLALSADGDVRSFAIRHIASRSVSIVRMNHGDLLDSRVVGPLAAILLSPGGVVISAVGSTVQVHRSDGTSWTADAGTRIDSLSQMNANWIHAAGPLKQFAIYFPTDGDPVLYQLPAIVEDR